MRFLEVCKTPELAVEVSPAAVSQVGVDRLSVFSDILIVAERWGCRWSWECGPNFGRVPVRRRADVAKLKQFDPEVGTRYLNDALNGSFARGPERMFRCWDLRRRRDAGVLHGGRATKELSDRLRFLACESRAVSGFAAPHCAGNNWYLRRKTKKLRRALRRYNFSITWCGELALPNIRSLRCRGAGSDRGVIGSAR